MWRGEEDKMEEEEFDVKPDIKEEVDVNEELDDLQDPFLGKVRAGESGQQHRKQPTGRAKKGKWSELTPEERAIKRAKDAERKRRRRAKMREEDLQAYLQKMADYKRRRREAMSEEELQAFRQKAAEETRRRRAAMSEEEIQASRQKAAEEMRRRRAAMSEEEIQASRQKAAEETRRRRAAMSEEKLAEERERQAEYIRLKREGITAEEARARRAELERWRVASKTPEQLAAFKARKAELACKRREAKRQQKKLRAHELTEEEREERRWKARMAKYARQARMTKEEREQDKQRRMDVSRKWREGLTGEKLERLKASQRRAVAKSQKKFHEKIIKNYQKKILEETPEQRWKRRRAISISQAKRLLRKKLENAGLSKEEIDANVNELVIRMKAEPMPPPETISTYKPRPRFRNLDLMQNFDPNSSRSSLLNSRTPSNAPVMGPAPVAHSSIAFPDYYQSMNEDSFDDCDIEGYPGPEETIKFTLSPSPPPQSCPHCPEFLSDENALKEHIRSFHLNKCFKCPKCKEVVFSPQELSDHFKTCNQPQPQIKLKEKESPSTNQPASTKKTPFICMKCPTSVGFPSQKKLSGHVQLSHPKSFWPCPHCKVIKYSESSLNCHLAICNMARFVCLVPWQEKVRKRKNAAKTKTKLKPAKAIRK